MMISLILNFKRWIILKYNKSQTLKTSRIITTKIVFAKNKITKRITSKMSCLQELGKIIKNDINFLCRPYA